MPDMRTQIEMEDGTILTVNDLVEKHTPRQLAQWLIDEIKKRQKIDDEADRLFAKLGAERHIMSEALRQLAKKIESRI